LKEALKLGSAELNPIQLELVRRTRSARNVQFGC
jgi:hypothetical protein